MTTSPLAFFAHVNQNKFLSGVKALLDVGHVGFLDALFRVVYESEKPLRMRHGTPRSIRKESSKPITAARKESSRGHPSRGQALTVVQAGKWRNERNIAARLEARRLQSHGAPSYGVSIARRDFAAGTLQPRSGSSPRFPAVKRLDSRTRVRRPSITAGTGSCHTPRMTKIIKAASPGESALEVMPTP